MLLSEPRSHGPVTVISSLAVNLACTFCSNPQPTIAGQLAAKFWKDGRSMGDELIVLAHRAGALGATEFVDVAAAAGERPVLTPVPRLASEDDDTRAMIVGRLELLRQSRRRRAGYVAMLGEAWEAFRLTWQDGVRRTDLAVARYGARISSGARWQEVASTPATDKFLPPLLAKVGFDVPVTLVPTLSLRQMFVLDIDDSIMVASPVFQGSGEQGTESLTRQLKALAHPTRLAVIRDLTAHPSSVGELARAFGLAQPTMTNHVKILREAGLLHPDETSRRGALRIDTAAVRQVLSEVGALADIGPASEA